MFRLNALAKISITPAMKENSYDLVDKLVKYQLQAKDVITAAFLPQRQEIILPENFPSALGAYKSLNNAKKLKERLEKVGCRSM